MGNASSNHSERLHFMTAMDMFKIIEDYPAHEEKMETQDHIEYL